MPYSQLQRMAKDKLESSTHFKMTSSLADLASIPHNDFSELVWENGQILLQGQSNRTRKTTFNTNPSIGPKGKDGDLPSNLKTTHCCLNDFSSSGLSSRQMGLGQEDKLVPWINYPLDDYCSEFFSELPGVDQNSFSAQNSAVPVLKNTNYGHFVRGSHGGANSEQGNAPKLVRESSESRLQRCESSFPSHRPSVPHLSVGCNTNNAQQANCGNSSQKAAGLLNTNTQQQEPKPSRPLTQLSNNTAIVNFSHFLRPATFVKTNRQDGDAAPVSSSLGNDRLRNNDKGSVVSCSNHIHSTVIDCANASRSLTDCISKPNSFAEKVDGKPYMGKPPMEPMCIEHPEADCRENTLGKSRSPDPALGQTSSFAVSTTMGMPDNEKYIEPVVASSSVCSGNNPKGASNDPKQRLKRTSRDTEELDYQSEDIEEESVGVRKPASARGGTSTKRSRAAEVHNLSERRRRDRINEKMRALQELIPNCNKVDKASMLDEAIEYLKTLQVQVQIMSMGTGLFMPPMMLPNGIPHINAQHLPPFAPMNVGMGMGMGMCFGMGMLDITGGSHGCPLVQVPPMHATQFSYPPISGPSSLPVMTSSSLQMFGPPGHGIPTPIPRAPFVPLSGDPSTKPVMLPLVPGVANPVEVPNAAVPSSGNT